MAFARAEIERQAPSPSSREEEVHAREAWVAADEEKAYLEAEEMFQTRAALDEERLEQGMLNMAGWTRHEVEAETAETIRVKDEAITSRDHKISRLMKDLAHQVKCLGQVREDFRRARDERNEHAAKIASLTATVDAQKMALAEAEEFKKSAGAHRVALEEKIRDLEGAMAFRTKPPKA